MTPNHLNSLFLFTRTILELGCGIDLILLPPPKEGIRIKVKKYGNDRSAGMNIDPYILEFPEIEKTAKMINKLLDNILYQRGEFYDTELL